LQECEDSNENLIYSAILFLILRKEGKLYLIINVLLILLLIIEWFLILLKTISIKSIEYVQTSIL
jgi:hypothetical protein